MCGIAGVISINPNLISKNLLAKMTDIIAHRGPDGEGHWISANGNVGFGHRRLSIIDLSHEADQPMHYMNRYTIVFNGEIYNYVELKITLQQQGYVFHNNSDTEVLMAMYHKYQENCLQYLDGMFAFVIYDSKHNVAFAARDRFGEKPFFYHYEKGKCFYFGSEMKCLWEAGVTKEVDNVMLFNYLDKGFVENPDDLSQTFYKDCKRLPHSHFIKINISDISICIDRYYDIDWKYKDESITEDVALETFKNLIYTSIKRRLRSDVVVGSSLSGGLDSSLVVTCVNELLKGTNQPQATFSAVFPGFEKDERKWMNYVIEKTDVTPYFVTPTSDDFLENIQRILWHQEEPIASASIYAQYCVMKLAKENNVTVLLDGQGADEILAGYHYYFPSFFAELHKYNKSVHDKELRIYLHDHNSNYVDVREYENWKTTLRRTLPFLNNKLGYLKNLVGKRNKLFNRDFFHEYRSRCFVHPYTKESLNKSLYTSTMQFGLQELLRYADRNSMAHGREVRLPFLYHELVEFVFSLPANFKIRKGWTKWIMREAFKNKLPNEIAFRKDKIGYEPPQKSWMTNPDIKGIRANSYEKLRQLGIIDEAIEEHDWKLISLASII